MFALTKDSVSFESNQLEAPLSFQFSDYSVLKAGQYVGPPLVNGVWLSNATFTEALRCIAIVSLKKLTLENLTVVA